MKSIKTNATQLSIQNEKRTALSTDFRNQIFLSRL